MKIKSILSIFLTFVLINCSNETTKSNDNIINLSKELNISEKKVVESSKIFGLELFREMVNLQPDSNIFISPLSVAMALGMTYNGAANETKTAMHDALAYDNLTSQEINEAFKNIIPLLSQIDPEVNFQLANSIWYRSGYPILPEFININQNYFNAVVDELDFSSNTAADIMNMWVNENTNGLIEEIIEPPIDPLTVMFLINTIYFKGTWTYEFDPDNTFESQFHTINGSTVPCQMMSLTSEQNYFENNLFQSVDLDYGNGSYSMTIILPKINVEVDDIISELNQTNWSEWTNGFNKIEMSLYLPKLKLRYDRKLNNVLKTLGMEIAFGGAADFSGITGSPDLYISKVKHKTYIEVNEEGTEAAAATSVEMREYSTGIMMEINRPYLFTIREKNSDTILFLGKIVEPIIEE